MCIRSGCKSSPCLARNDGAARIAPLAPRSPGIEQAFDPGLCVKNESMRAIVAKRTKPCHGCSQPTLSTRRWGATTGRRESARPSRRPFHRRRKTAFGNRMSRCSNEAAAPRHAAYAADGRTLGDNLPRMQARACRHRGAPGLTLTPFMHIHPMSRLILIAALILAGCASPIVFRDPQNRPHGRMHDVESRALAVREARHRQVCRGIREPGVGPAVAACGPRTLHAARRGISRPRQPTRAPPAPKTPHPATAPGSHRGACPRATTANGPCLSSYGRSRDRKSAPAGRVGRFSSGP